MLPHRAHVGAFLITLYEADHAGSLYDERPGRAIGVIYRREQERAGQYLRARLSERFDALLHIDETQALEPLEPDPGWHTGDAPETSPFRT